MKVLKKFSIFSAWAPMRVKDVLCFDLIGDAVRVASLKILPSKKIISEVFYKDVRGLAPPEVVKVLKDFLESRRGRDFIAVATVPSHLVITKNIEIPSQDPKEIKDIINLQAGRLTPYSRDEVIIDYVPIGSFRQSYTKLLLVIVSKDVVHKQLALLNEAGIQARRVVLSCEAIGGLVYHHLKLELQESPFCVIHTDATTTDFGIFLKDKQIFLRSISVGAVHLLHEKEKYLSRFIDELKKSFDAYHAEDIETSPTLAVFTGAVAGLRDLEVMMLDAFRMPVRIVSAADFIPRGEYLSSESVNPREISMLGVLAPPFRQENAGINLVPEEIKLRMALELRGREIIKTGILVMTTLLFIFAYFMVNIYFKTEYLRRLDQKYKTLTTEAAGIEKDFTKVRIIRNYLVSRGRSLNILAELYDLTPLEIALTNIRFKDVGSFSVRGEASSMSVVFSYIGALEKSPYFKSVKTKNTSKKKVDAQEIVDFELSFVLEGVSEEAS
jgi:Tfp pilus assembly PilM family ATPase